MRDSALGQDGLYQGKDDDPRPRPAQPDPPHPGALLELAVDLQARLQHVEEALDLDELDKLARRHARAPASGFPDALQALAYLSQAAPGAFAGADVNLDPARLRALADRGRALLLLAPLVDRFRDVLRDSLLELGDEAVVLLETALGLLQRLGELAELGWAARAAAAGIEPTREFEDARAHFVQLALLHRHTSDGAALHEHYPVLRAYEVRVGAEGAHRSEVQRHKERDKQGKLAKPQVPQKAAQTTTATGQQLHFPTVDPPGSTSPAAAATPAVPPAGPTPDPPLPATLDTAPAADPDPGPGRPARRFGRLRPLVPMRLAQLLDVPLPQRLLRLRCLLGRPVTPALLGDLPAICRALAEGDAAEPHAAAPGAIKPRQSPCPVCRRGQSEIHACCPCGLTAQGAEEVEVFFGLIEGRRPQTRCRFCRPFSVAAPQTHRESEQTEKGSNTDGAS